MELAAGLAARQVVKLAAPETSQVFFFGRAWCLVVSATGTAVAEAGRCGRQEGVAGVSGAVAQAMRCAGCPSRRSLGVSGVFPHQPLWSQKLNPWGSGLAAVFC